MPGRCADPGAAGWSQKDRNHAFGLVGSKEEAEALVSRIGSAHAELASTGKVVILDTRLRLRASAIEA